MPELLSSNLVSTYCEESGGWTILEGPEKRHIATFIREQDAGDYLAHFEIIPQVIAERDALEVRKAELLKTIAKSCDEDRYQGDYPGGCPLISAAEKRNAELVKALEAMPCMCSRYTNYNGDYITVSTCDRCAALKEAT